VVGLRSFCENIPRGRSGIIAFRAYIRGTLNCAQWALVNLNFGTCAMADFDYSAAAELFSTRRRMPRRQPLGYRRFAQAAQAIRFAIEDLEPELLVGAFLEVGEERFDSGGIRQLYDSAEYPLARRVVHS
jgi:hypothetical protein